MATPAHPLGVAMMDDDHAVIEAIIESATAAPDDQLRPLLDALMQEMAVHFAREEALMREMDFPGLHCHLAQHRIVLEEAQAPGKASAGELRRHIAEYVAQILTSHVLTMDFMTAAFLKGEFGTADFANLRLPVEEPVR